MRTDKIQTSTFIKHQSIESLQGAGGVAGLLAVENNIPKETQHPLFDGNGNVLPVYMNPLIVRGNYKVQLLMFGVFYIMSIMGISSGDTMGILISVIGLCVLATFVLYHVIKYYFIIAQNGILLEGSRLIEKSNIVNYCVTESIGKREDYYSCVRIEIQLNQPLGDDIFNFLQSKRWVSVFEGKNGVVINLEEPGVSSKNIRNAFEDLMNSQ